MFDVCVCAFEDKNFGVFEMLNTLSGNENELIHFGNAVILCTLGGTVIAWTWCALHEIGMIVVYSLCVFLAILIRYVRVYDMKWLSSVFGVVKGKFFVVSVAIIAVFPVKCVNFVVDLPKPGTVARARDREHKMTCFDIKTDNNVVSNGNAQVNLSTYYIY